MAQFKGDSRDAKRARQGARVQEEMKEAFERKIQQMRQETEAAVQNMELNQMFSYEESTADKKFKDSIVGLQSHDEYKNKLDTYLEHNTNNNNGMDEDYQCNDNMERTNSNKNQESLGSEDAPPISNTSHRLKQLEKQLLCKKNKNRKRKNTDPVLSFDFDEDVESHDMLSSVSLSLLSNSDRQHSPVNGNAPTVVPAAPAVEPAVVPTVVPTAPATATPAPEQSIPLSEIEKVPLSTEDVIRNGIVAVPSNKRRKISKNPHVDTSFLPDPERDAADARLRMELEKEWNERQKQVKRERLEITYSYWDGSGHRRSIEIVKGMKVGEFLELCRKELAQHFSELRGISGEHLMYIKDDLIIPHSYAFYDLIVASGRGKSGNYMFKNESYDKGDYRIERDGGHPGKIITRAWYDRNKHIFPASRWEVYDPTNQDENR